MNPSAFPRTLRGLVKRLKKDGLLETHARPVDRELELARICGQSPRDALRTIAVKGFAGRVITGLAANRNTLATTLDVATEDLAGTLKDAEHHPGAVQLTEKAPFMQNRIQHPDLMQHLPLGRFYPADGGPYATAFVVAGQSARYGLNLSFHRMMVLGKNRLAVRVVRRHLHQILNETNGRATVALFCGVHPAVLLAAAVSASPALDELKVAARLTGGVLDCVEVADGLFVPAQSEVVMRGRFTGERTAEGPFVDLTGTYDTIRQEPVLEIDTLWMRDNPYYHTILPAGPEHKLLMGLPREPAILEAARKVAPNVSAVCLTAGGCAWLHGVVAIENPAPGQPVNVGMAALSAHPSLKKVVVVDADIDIYDPQAVEWATATRMQPDRDLTVVAGARGSSLDPSRDPETETTAKWIVDATLDSARTAEFVRADRLTDDRLTDGRPTDDRLTGERS
jgi:UbiD family decarboxylase